MNFFYILYREVFEFSIELPKLHNVGEDFFTKVIKMNIIISGGIKMKSRKLNHKFYICIALSIILLMVSFAGSGFSVDAAVNTTKKYGIFRGKTPSTYKFEGATIHIVPYKVYYKDKKLVYQAYVYNNTDETIYYLRKVKLTLRDSKKKLIARQTFLSSKTPLKIEAGKYRKYTFTFTGSNIKNKKFYFSQATKLQTSASYYYYR